MTSECGSAPADVVVLGKDKLVGRTLEQLLRSATYTVRFRSETSLGEPGVLDKVRLLILAPGLSAESREAVWALANSKTVELRITVWELDDGSRTAEVGARHLVPWPCLAEELKGKIEALLLAGSEASQDSQRPQTPQEERGMVDDQGLD